MNTTSTVEVHGGTANQVAQEAIRVTQFLWRESRSLGHMRDRQETLGRAQEIIADMMMGLDAEGTNMQLCERTIMLNRLLDGIVLKCTGTVLTNGSRRVAISDFLKTNLDTICLLRNGTAGRVTANELNRAMSLFLALTLSTRELSN